MHDKNGKPLAIGDRIYIPAIVKDLFPAAEICNISVELTIPNQEGGSKAGWTLTARQVEKYDPIVLNMPPEPKTGLDFGDAIRALKEGKRVCRPIWDGPFLFRQVPASISAEIIPKMQSLPEAVKTEFIKRETPAINYSNQIAIVHVNNEIHGYSPSSEDALAEDWEILN